MGRGPVVAGRKAVQDAARGKVFAIHAKLIAVAARGGGDPAENPSLREVIEKARKDSVPKDVIDRAIKRGTGEDKDASEIIEITYEGYGPGGVAVIARALTDNKNRTAGNIRTIFNKHEGNLGETGSLSSHVLTYKGVIEVQGGEELEEVIIDSGAEDYSPIESGYRVICEKTDFARVKNALEGKGEITTSGLEYLPNLKVEVTEFEKGLHIVKLLQDLEEDEDIEKVWTNGSIDDGMMEEIEQYIEERTFKT